MRDFLRAADIFHLTLFVQFQLLGQAVLKLEACTHSAHRVVSISVLFLSVTS